MSKDLWIIEHEQAEILQALKDGEMDVLCGAEDLRDLGMPDEEIAAAVGWHWPYIKEFWRRVAERAR